MSRRSLALPGLLLIVTACAAQGPFPSLAPRAVEKEAAAPLPAPEATPVAADPRLAGLVSELLGRAREGQSAFAAALPAASRAVSAAGAAGSEAWVEAQQAVSRLESARAATVLARSDADALLLARYREGIAADDLAALQAAVAEVQALEEQQKSEIERLAGSLSAI